MDRPDVFAQQGLGPHPIRRLLGNRARPWRRLVRPMCPSNLGRRRSTTIASHAPNLYPPLVHCKPSGGPGFFNAPGFEIVDVPEQQRVFILNIAGPHSWRVIYTDGRAHPTDLRPTYLGHSIGRWEGGTLVIDTVGFNEKQWMVGATPRRSAAPDRAHLAAGHEDAELRGHDRRSRRVPGTVVTQVDDLRDVEVSVDPRRGDLRVHLPG